MSLTASEFILKLRYRIDDFGSTEIFIDNQLEDILLECTRVEGYDSFNDIDNKFINLILKHAVAECWFLLSKYYSELYAEAQGTKSKFRKMVGGGALDISLEESDLSSLKENAVTAFQNGKNAFDEYLALKDNLLNERQPEPSMSTTNANNDWGNNVKTNDMGEDISNWGDNVRVKIKF